MDLQDFLNKTMGELFDIICDLERKNETVKELQQKNEAITEELGIIRNERNKLADNWPKKFKSPIPGIGREI